MVKIEPMERMTKSETDLYARVVAAVTGTLVAVKKYRDKAPLTAVIAREQALEAIRAKRQK